MVQTSHSDVVKTVVAYFSESKFADFLWMLNVRSRWVQRRAGRTLCSVMLEDALWPLQSVSDQAGMFLAVCS